MSLSRAHLSRLRRSARIRRCVWALLTRKPRASLHEIVAWSGLSLSTVHDAIYALRDAGYIDFVDGSKRARAIIVPFIIAKRNHDGHR
jgi:DNA-binding IclR family transcriptional regulator